MLVLRTIHNSQTYLVTFQATVVKKRFNHHGTLGIVDGSKYIANLSELYEFPSISMQHC